MNGDDTDEVVLEAERTVYHAQWRIWEELALEHLACTRGPGPRAACTGVRWDPARHLGRRAPGPCTAGRAVSARRMLGGRAETAGAALRALWQRSGRRRRSGPGLRQDHQEHRLRPCAGAMVWRTRDRPAVTDGVCCGTAGRRPQARREPRAVGGDTGRGRDHPYRSRRHAQYRVMPRKKRERSGEPTPPCLCAAAWAQRIHVALFHLGVPAWPGRCGDEAGRWLTV